MQEFFVGIPFCLRFLSYCTQSRFSILHLALFLHPTNCFYTKLIFTWRSRVWDRVSSSPWLDVKKYGSINQGFLFGLESAVACSSPSSCLTISFLSLVFLVSVLQNSRRKFPFSLLSLVWYSLFFQCLFSTLKFCVKFGFCFRSLSANVCSLFVPTSARIESLELKMALHTAQNVYCIFSEHMVAIHSFSQTSPSFRC